MLPQDFNKERRQFPRFDFREAVEYKIDSTRHSGGCLAQDISEGGLKVNVSDFVPLGTEINVKVYLGPSPISRAVDAVAEVVWVQRVPFSDRYWLGLEFKRMDAGLADKQKLAQFIHSLREDNSVA